MHRPAILVGCAAAAITISLCASSVSAQQRSGGVQSYGSQARPAAPHVAVVDINALPRAIQSQVNAMIAQTKSEDLQVLRNSIDAMPEASAALRTRGLKSEEVVAALVDDEGGLTLITNEEI